MHHLYLRNNNYYRASVLAGTKSKSSTGIRLDNVDQRISHDIMTFSKSLAELFSRTFKPAIDVWLCTQKLAPSVGYKGPFFMEELYSLIYSVSWK